MVSLTCILGPSLELVLSCICWSDLSICFEKTDQGPSYNIVTINIFSTLGACLDQVGESVFILVG